MMPDFFPSVGNITLSLHARKKTALSLLEITSQHRRAVCYMSFIFSELIIQLPYTHTVLFYDFCLRSLFSLKIFFFFFILLGLQSRFCTADCAECLDIV
jgi:hypothetical protein